MFTIPVTGGVPFRVTYHPAADVAVGWTRGWEGDFVPLDREFRQSRYTQLYTSAGARGDCQGAAAADGVPGAVFAGRKPDCVFAAAAGIRVRLLCLVCGVGQLSRRAGEHDLDHNAAGAGFGGDSA